MKFLVEIDCDVFEGDSRELGGWVKSILAKMSQSTLPVKFIDTGKVDGTVFAEGRFDDMKSEITKKEKRISN